MCRERRQQANPATESKCSKRMPEVKTMDINDALVHPCADGDFRRNGNETPPNEKGTQTDILIITFGYWYLFE